MSLDLYLFRKRSISYDGKKTFVEDNEMVFNINITHNLGKMAEACGIYDILWRPEENGIEKASQLIEPLTVGLKKLKENQSFYEKFNSNNGWGLYCNFVPFVEEYLNACIMYPDAKVEASR